MNVDYADVHDVIFSNINIEADEVIPKPLIQKGDANIYTNTDPSYMPRTVCVQVVFHHEYSAGGERRGKNRDMLFRDIQVYSDRMPKVKCVGYDALHKTENILIQNLACNGRPITELVGQNWDVGIYAENIRLE
jgi:hypothetical protein